LHYVGPPKFRPSRVFVADDDEDMHAMMTTALRTDGYEVVEANDGKELLTRLREAFRVPVDLPDVIVVDVILPKYSGFRVIEFGAASFLRKPFTVDALRAAVVNASLPTFRVSFAMIRDSERGSR
jgi:DNA-binding response OmpR family regulator